MILGGLYSHDLSLFWHWPGAVWSWSVFQFRYAQQERSQWHWSCTQSVHNQRDVSGPVSCGTDGVHLCWQKRPGHHRSHWPQWVWTKDLCWPTEIRKNI